MERKQRLFIYDRKEIAVLIALGILVAFFAFTFGVHMGKRVTPKAVTANSSDAKTADTRADAIPGRQDLMDQAREAPEDADQAMEKSLKEEVSKSGVKLDTSRQMDLPKKPKTATGGATT